MRWRGGGRRGCAWTYLLEDEVRATVGEVDFREQGATILWLRKQFVRISQRERRKRVGVRPCLAVVVSLVARAGRDLLREVNEGLGALEEQGRAVVVRLQHQNVGVDLDRNSVVPARSMLIRTCFVHAFGCHQTIPSACEINDARAGHILRVASLYITLGRPCVSWRFKGKNQT
eukprot:SAG11_NODE_590_length_8314_cov_44.934388_6_plen_174_part_00